MEHVLYAHISTVNAVTTHCSTRIYANSAPQFMAYPAVIYSRLDTKKLNTLSGPANLENVTFQMDSIALTMGVAHKLSTAVHNAMINSTAYKAILTFDQDASEPIDDKTMLYKISQVFSCWYQST